MRPLVGLIPAAGAGSRLGIQQSKEIAPVVDPEAGADRQRPVVFQLLDGMEAAGIETAYVVLRSDKRDVVDRLAERSDRLPRLAYLMIAATRSIPETLDHARPFVRGHDVLMGFPDVVFRPLAATRALCEARRRIGTDIALALFPSDRPDKTDMVELDGEAVTGFRVKPGPCELEYTWILATWGDRFTEFLGACLERPADEPPPDDPRPELQMSQVMAAALDRGLTIGACKFSTGRFIDVGTPEDLARAQRWRAP